MSKTTLDITDVFAHVADRVNAKRDYLPQFHGFKNQGLEGWFTVQAILALGERVERIQLNNGPDLVLRDAAAVIEVELKAASDLNPSWVLRDAKKYLSRPNFAGCVFLGDGTDEGKMDSLCSDEEVQLYTHRRFHDGTGWWLIGLFTPRESLPPIASLTRNREAPSKPAGREKVNRRRTKTSDSPVQRLVLYQHGKGYLKGPPNAYDVTYTSAPSEAKLYDPSKAVGAWHYHWYTGAITRRGGPICPPAELELRRITWQPNGEWSVEVVDPVSAPETVRIRRYGTVVCEPSMSG